MMKHCNKCNTTKPIDEFFRNPIPKDKRASCCKVCSYKNTLEWRTKNPEKYRQYLRKGHLKHAYGITVADWERMRDEQNGTCAICNGSGGEYGLVVDHDHKSDRVRALLCQACNSAIGSLRESPDLCLKAAEYLQRHSSNVAEVSQL